jgi:hypothetical protein
VCCEASLDASSNRRQDTGCTIMDVLHYRLQCAGELFKGPANRATQASDDNMPQQNTKGEKPIFQAVTRHGLRKRMILVSPPLFAMRETAANRCRPAASSNLPQPAVSLPPLLHVHALTEETRGQGVREYRPHQTPSCRLA